MTEHAHRVLRHPVVLRTLDVLRVERLTPHMQRVVFGGEQLRGFHSPAPDDHVKLFFPNRHGEFVTPTLGPNGPEYPPGREPSPARDYTPRRHDAARGELAIDFVLHGDGPASTWAAQAAPGQRLVAGGPRGSFVVADDFDAYVLAGDETALPAIGRWLEELPARARAIVLAEIPEAADRQPLPSAAAVEVTWLERDGADAAADGPLERALRALPAPRGDAFWWIAAESRRARAMRQYLHDERGVPKDWLKATGYWKADAAAP
ncbi:siderophore-interacting protein [Fulvimonas soli]|uniref:NADPH-dependent ferric siderophore reductase n=1 Tax=Fulvimonas soli TaxID=155197 RepID=A0A316IXQ5_9GAMM|nr:siderophore-interacting protein [Fulvimonas soli]PWK91965.1 NADPH-dependent ferric siderophore reductase [Fulvimonas soli]TNY25161.1 NADPH-dependent ferric siderophore reductase [Fulvimonas soli]